MIHLHQGGTVNTYCGLPLAVAAFTGSIVSWEDAPVSWAEAPKATCSLCTAAFGRVSA